MDIRKPNITSLSGDFSKIALLSDTHGLWRSEMCELLQGAELILHAGDVGDLEMLDKMKALAPTYAVCGNVDISPGLSSLPTQMNLRLPQGMIVIGHERLLIHLEGLGDVRLVLFGHTHKPMKEKLDGRWWVNPGSIGPRRFRLPISFAWLCIQDGIWDVSHVELDAS